MVAPGAGVEAAGPTQGSEAGTTNGIQEGGFSPAAVAVLNGLDEQQRAVLSQELRQKESYVAAERQRWKQQIQMAGVLDGWLKDPEFVRFVRAKESGNTATFYRSELGVAAGETDHSTGDQDATTPGVGGEEAQGQPGDTPLATDRANAALLQKVSELESRLNAQQKLENERSLASFAEKFPDHEEYLPAMQARRNTHPEDSLEDLYIYAKGQASLTGQVSAVEGDTEQQAPAQTTPSPSTTQPPIPVGTQTGTAEPEGVPTSIDEAFQLAKQQHGIEGEVVLEFTP